jgi:excinuclease ABC subunit C
MLPAFINPSQIPHKPGVYRYKDSSGKIIYVGKAIDLHNRVSSYFNGRAQDTKTIHLVQNIASVETTVVESEIEALILEANLIKQYLPLYNIKLTDDKDYLYIVITKEEFPKVITGRKYDLKFASKYFGPFPSSTTVKTTLKKLRRVFPWCSNPPGSKNKTKRPCFYYHIGQCPGACVGVINSDDYKKTLTLFSKFLEGKKQELLDDLNQEMVRLSDGTQYEEAAKMKKIIDGIAYVTSPTKIQGYLENPNFLEDLNMQGMEDLQKELGLPTLPRRIEGYDISNFQGTDATGSMVVLTNGEIDKSQYRKFKIKISGKPNDYAMHAEMAERRLKHPEWPLPDLFLIDGGRGQVQSVYKVHQKLGINVPIFGLAKRMEWLYPPEGEVVRLPKRNFGLRLLQKLRDESHRFAITYHRKLRANSFLKPVLKK